MPAEIALSGKRSFFGRHPFDNRAQGLLIGSDATRVANHHAGRNAPSRFITCFSLAEVWRYYDSAPVTLTHEWSGTPGFTTDEYPVVGRLDGRNMWIIGGMCGSGTAVSFNGARHVVTRVLGMDDDCDGQIDPETAADATRIAEEVRGEWVVQVKGTVNRRPEGSENPAMDTGDIEILTTEITVLNRSLTPPFYIEEDSEADESLRLRYRYLDLRRPPMLRNLTLRHQVVKYIRDFLSDRDFLEIETPILIKSTPEGARDFLVPSRMQPGNFYALPQSPQQMKQLLMVAGVERYFQIARCFRDEDLRADRQLEFTQLDLEMSFVEEDDILDLTEALYTGMIESVSPEKKLRKPFPRITYAEAMERYASDKPDLRFGLEMTDVSELAIESEFRVFLSAIEGSGQIKGFVVPGQTSQLRCLWG